MTCRVISPTSDDLHCHQPPESTRIWNDVKVSQSHLLSHWNFNKGEKMSVETYTTGEEAELFLNNKSLGTKKREGKPGEEPRLIWRFRSRRGH